ncbi:MAG: hypothetical protein JW810_00705 [Sedimentisphaerales bacterium]|nr:hypothetical protein [Sedimentisphaerales bacterium]
MWRTMLLTWMVVSVLSLSGADGQVILNDAQWQAASQADQVTLITDIPGDPGLQVDLTVTGGGTIDMLRYDYPWPYADLSEYGTTFVVELENPGDVGYNLNPFSMSGSWVWTDNWQWIGPGQTIVYTVTFNDPTLVEAVGIQFNTGTAGDYTVKIVGGVVDFAPSDPVPADGDDLGVLVGGNRLRWTNHSVAYPLTGDDIVCDVYLGTDPNDLITDPDTTVFTEVGNFVVAELTEGVTYYWQVYAFEPGAYGGEPSYISERWSFNAVEREPRTRYQAEDATIEPGADTAPELRNDADADGGQIVWTNWNGDSRGSFAWNVKTQQAGLYTLTVRYKISGTDDRGDKVEINGEYLNGGNDFMYPGSNGVFMDYLIENVSLVEGVNTIRIGTSWGGISYDYFELNLDDLTATKPQPTVGEVVLVDDNTLSWKKHSLFDPENASDVLCNVYLGTREPNESLEDYGITLIASETPDSETPVSLEWGQNYYWVVDSIVPVDGVDTLFPGYAWNFTTLDPAAEITLDASRTVKRTVSTWMGATVTDLGVPGLSYEWSLVDGPNNVVIEDICADTTALDPEFVFDVLGLHTLKLTVTDGADNISEATIDVTVIEFFRALRIEAEEGTILAGDTAPEIRRDELASEHRLMWTTWSGTNRGSFVLNFDSPEAGTFDMIIHYKVGGTGARGDKIKINGLPASPGDTMFPGTSGVFDDFAYGAVTLNQGHNSIEVLCAWGGISYDYIEFPFLEAPRAPYDPDPSNWENVPTTGATELSWSFDPNSPETTVTSVVYFGDAEPDEGQTDFGMTKIEAGTATTVAVPETLQDNATYYWFVIATESDAPNDPFQGRLWHFITIPPCEWFAWGGDLDFDCDVDNQDLYLLISGWLTEGGATLADYAEFAAHWLTCIDPVTGEPAACD